MFINKQTIYAFSALLKKVKTRERRGREDVD